MLPIPVYGRWRRVWDRKDTLRALGERADALARRRNKGNFVIPSSLLLHENARVLSLFRPVYDEGPDSD